jgi:probable HAF family extracellular repeat protein
MSKLRYSFVILVGVVFLLGVTSVVAPRVSWSQDLEKPGPAQSLSHKRPTILDMRLPDELPSKHGMRGHRFASPKSRRQKNVNPDRDDLATIPHWSDTFTYQGLTYKYTMVGTNPKHGSATTTIPTVLIPIRFTFEDGTVVDANNDDFGRRNIDSIISSPIFQPTNFTVGDVNVGNTQYGDAFQRANFWKFVSDRARDYHVLLGQPSVAPTYDAFVPADQGFVSHHDDGSIWAFVQDGFLAEIAVNAVQQGSVSPQTLPIVLLGPQMGVDSHGSYEVPGGVQTYVFCASFTANVSSAILDWLNNPFNDNFTPGYHQRPLFFGPSFRCESSLPEISPDVFDQLEAAAYFFHERVITTSSGAYLLGNGRFLDYFTRAAPSRSAGEQYTFFPLDLQDVLPNSPSPPCTGHVEVEMTTLEYPGANSTTALGINNRGSIVGSFLDASNRRHGFIYNGRNFTQLDHPSAVRGTTASKINEAGQVVGWYFDAAGLPHGFLYFQGNFISIDFPGSIDNTTLAIGINSRGDIVGLYDATVEITHGFIYQNGQYRTLDAPFGQQAEIRGINDSGLIVGDSYDDPFNGPVHGFSLDANGFTQFDFPDALFTLPYAVNNRGMQGGIFLDQSFERSGFVTIYGYPYEIYGNVFGMNDKREIVGSRFDPDSGRTVGYVATLPK